MFELNLWTVTAIIWIIFSIYCLKLIVDYKRNDRRWHSDVKFAYGLQCFYSATIAVILNVGVGFFFFIKWMIS